MGPRVSPTTFRALWVDAMRKRVVTNFFQICVHDGILIVACNEVER
jgi:hypothetical protein